jgi:hypothetical protein
VTVPVPQSKFEHTSAITVIAIVLVVLSLLSASRQYFGTGTETDFLLHFIKDAISFQERQPMALFMHPPLYAITVGTVHGFVGDWFAAGRLIALASSAVVLLASYAFYRSVIGPAAGWGSIVALAACPMFILHSTQATTEIFFLAIYCALIWVAYEGERRDSVGLWMVTGALIGFASLTRTNGVTTFLIVLVPLISPGLSIMRRGVHFVAVLGGTGLVLLFWISFAMVTGSPLTPSNAIATNLALTYFMPEDVGVNAWTDGFTIIHGQFAGIVDVIMHDPKLVLGAYAENLLQLPNRVLSSGALFVFPFGFLVLPALIYLFFVPQSRWVLYVAVLALAQVAVASLITFHYRFYLFLVPLFGAAMGFLVHALYLRSEGWRSRLLSARIGVSLIILLFVFGLADSGRRAIESMNYPMEAEFAESIPIARRVVTEPAAVIVAGKPNVAHYVNGEHTLIPHGDSIQDLDRFVDSLASEKGGPVYVYYGLYEQWRRPEYRILREPDEFLQSLPDWEVAAESPQPKGWRLYRRTVRTSGGLSGL